MPLNSDVWGCVGEFLSTNDLYNGSFVNQLLNEAFRPALYKRLSVNSDDATKLVQTLMMTRAQLNNTHSLILGASQANQPNAQQQGGFLIVLVKLENLRSIR